jgi:ParB-like chromosome segregation protein Spo0J
MLKIVQKPVDKLIPYVNNSRTHSDEQIAQIAASIKEFGWTNPILVDGENGIIAGHGRLMAARKLGYTEVPTIELKDLTETQRKAYIIADNRLALNAGWDNEILTIELNDLLADGFALEMLGFDSGEIQSLISEEEENYPDSSAKEIDVDDFQMGHQCPKCGFEFDAKT